MVEKSNLRCGQSADGQKAVVSNDCLFIHQIKQVGFKMSFKCGEESFFPSAKFALLVKLLFPF